MIVAVHKFIPGRGPKSGGKGVGISKALAHISYIMHRPGPDRVKGGRELFNERDNLDAQDMREAIKRLGGNRVVVHKVSLSPEINAADKKAYTREVMAALSRDKGQDLEWFAAEHDNTDHHHVHVVILGKDRNGIDVRVDMKDIDKIKEYSDRYLERWHPREMERSKKERETRERDGREEKNKAREVAREERVRSAELPWMHRKIIREQLQPYRLSRATAERNDDLPAKATKVIEKPVQRTVEAAGKEWSKDADLDELRNLNAYLWDNIEERIPKEDYRRLSGWIKEKERLRAEPGDDRKSEKEQEQPRIEASDKNKKEQVKEEKLVEQIEFKGETYKKGDPYEKLTGLVSKTREAEERLPFDDYQKMRNWIEDADRARWSGALEKQMELTHKKFDRSKTMEDLKAAEGGRVLEPAMEDLMRNPVVGLFLKVASISNAIVRAIPLDDRLRDPLKEGRDDLEAGKKGIDERDKERIATPKSGMRPEQLQSLSKSENKDKANRDRLEQDIEKNKKAKDRELKKQKEDRNKDNREEWDVFDPWGMY